MTQMTAICFVKASTARNDIVYDESMMEGAAHLRRCQSHSLLHESEETQNE